MENDELRTVKGIALGGAINMAAMASLAMAECGVLDDRKDSVVRKLLIWMRQACRDFGVSHEEFDLVWAEANRDNGGAKQ